jgi:hypothetical protein
MYITHHIDLHPQAYESPILQRPKFHYGILRLQRPLDFRRGSHVYRNPKFRRQVLQKQIRRSVHVLRFDSAYSNSTHGKFH